MSRQKKRKEKKLQLMMMMMWIWMMEKRKKNQTNRSYIGSFISILTCLYNDIDCTNTHTQDMQIQPTNQKKKINTTGSTDLKIGQTFIYQKYRLTEVKKKSKTIMTISIHKTKQKTFKSI